MSQLIDALRKALDIKPSPPDPVPEPVQPAWYRRMSKKQWAGVAAVVVVLGVVSEQQQDTFEPDPVLPEPVSPYVQPAAPTPSVSPVYNQPAPRPTLSGAWQDSEGGRYQLIEQGDGGFRFEGMSPHGAVMGMGGIVNNILTITYTLNGVQYAAQLELSPDGNWLRGGYASAVTGERGLVLMQRIP